MNNSKCNDISLDTSSVMREIKNHLMKHLAKAEDRLLDIMEREILNTTYKDAPGKPEWREMLRDRLEVIRETVTDEYIRAEVGLDSNMLFTDFVKAMIVAVGSGSRVGNGSIEAGPTGRIVWDDNVDGQRPSDAQGNYLLPLEFNQRGNEFVKNSIALMRKHFNDTLEEAAESLPSSVFYKNVHVKGASR